MADRWEGRRGGGAGSELSAACMADRWEGRGGGVRVRCFRLLVWLIGGRAGGGVRVRCFRLLEWLIGGRAWGGRAGSDASG